MADIKFSPDALEDLRQAKAYIAEDLCNEAAAANTVSKILKSIRMLSAFPKSGAPLSSVMSIDTDYRFLVCGNYTAFYRYEQDTIFVVRVLYGRRDFMRILFETTAEQDDVQ